METFALKKQYDFYANHETELLEKYNGMYLVITDSLQVFPFAEAREAYRYGAKNFGGGHFMLQECTPGILNVVHRINSFA